MTDGGNKHHLEFEADLANLALLAEFIENMGIDLGLPDEARRALELATDEAVTNVISYAYEGQKPGPVRLTLSRIDKKAYMVIEDEGMGFDLADVKEPNLDAPIEERDIGGLGWFFIKEMTNGYTYERNGGVNRLTMVKYLE